jgi:hypothetical protein
MDRRICRKSARAEFGEVLYFQFANFSTLIRRNQRNERERKKKARPSFLELETLNIKLKDFELLQK